jgi:hypothetical protein
MRVAALLVAAMAVAGCQAASSPVDAGTDDAGDAGDSGADSGLDGGDAGLQAVDACVDGGIGAYCASFSACICCDGTPDDVCCQGTGLECGWQGLGICPTSDTHLGCAPLGCADLNWDNQNCGGCGTACDPSMVCGAGSCMLPDASLSCPNPNNTVFSALSGSLFMPSFAGTFRGLLPDGGLNAASFNVVLSNQDLSVFCAIPLDGGYATPSGPYQVLFIALSTDGGAIGAGCYASGPTDGPDFAVDLFDAVPDAGVVLDSYSHKDQGGGAIAVDATDDAVGVFKATMMANGGGSTTVTGTFSAQSCQGLAYVH